MFSPAYGLSPDQGMKKIDWQRIGEWIFEDGQVLLLKAVIYVVFLVAIIAFGRLVIDFLVLAWHRMLG